MLIRYATSQEGKRTKRAQVYTGEEHGIHRKRIDPEALLIARRLSENGYSAYIVGGAVRDLLIGREPKDFDIVTDATPNRIKRIFRNSRIIGKRFRLVHIHFRDKIFEVSTFRSLSSEGGADNGGETPNSIYGRIEEDVLRRDFTMNALYYSPKEEYIIDYVGGVSDIRASKIRCLIPIETIFVDDPVRMIRAVKYSAVTGFPLGFRIRSAIKKHSGNLESVPVSRLTEELLKILLSGVSRIILLDCYKLNVMDTLLPVIRDRLEGGRKGLLDEMIGSLSTLDARIADGDVTRGGLIAALVDTFITMPSDDDPEGRPLKSRLFWEVKQCIEPLTPPNTEIDEAVTQIMEIRGISQKSSQPRKRKPGGRPRRRRRKSGTGVDGGAAGQAENA